MSTILLYAIGATITVAILMSLPLVKHIMSPVLDAIISGFGLVLAHTGSYVVWMAKGVVGAHFTVLNHLLHRKSWFDPTDGLE